MKDPPYSSTDYSGYTKDCAGLTVPSEPGAKAAFDLIKRIKPVLTIWYLARSRAGAKKEIRGKTYPAWVDKVVGDERAQKAEREFARLVRLPLAGAEQGVEPFGGYPGSGSSWQARTFPHDVAFWVELPAGPLSRADVEARTRDPRDRSWLVMQAQIFRFASASGGA